MSTELPRPRDDFAGFGAYRTQQLAAAGSSVESLIAAIDRIFDRAAA